MSFHAPEDRRVNHGFGALPSGPEDGNNGLFVVPNPFDKLPFRIQCSDGDGWEHVSVSLRGRIPRWAEMCWIKKLFWDAEDTVVQYHPPESQYVNNCATCLHLWRPTNAEMPAPPKWMVGV